MELLHFALCYCSAELHSPVGVGALVIAEAFLANTEDSFFFILYCAIHLYLKCQPKCQYGYCRVKLKASFKNIFTSNDENVFVYLSVSSILYWGPGLCCSLGWLCMWLGWAPAVVFTSGIWATPESEVCPYRSRHCVTLSAVLPCYSFVVQTADDITVECELCSALLQSQAKHGSHPYQDSYG